jgi:aryl-alcohol dehydrogenase-like predicted oxidoreductase
MAVTNSPEHIKSYIEGTIERLGFTPDLYYLHRIDPSKHPSGSNAAANRYADQE